MSPIDLRTFRQEVETELKGNILGFWMERSPDDDFGGFRGRVSNSLVVEPEAEKGIILNTRILWTFSRAFRIYGEPRLLAMANRAYDYIDRCFIDRDFGGVYWTVDHLGRPLDIRKRTYAQAFAIYALSEYFVATGEKSASQTARDIFALLETRARNRIHGGYLETFERDWTLADDQRLSPVDQDDPRSMNTHLHVLEAYAGLANALAYEPARSAIRDTLMLFLEHIVDPETFHCRLFFDDGWHIKSNRISYGHDIEASWLLCEAARVVREPGLMGRVDDLALRMATAVRATAIDRDGALFNEGGPAGITDYNKHWWPQAEAVVGFLNAFQLTSEERFLTGSVRCWEFIRESIVDRVHGEWFWKVSRDRTPDDSKPKIDQWKGPYHNGRMCFEVMSRLNQIEGIAK